MQFRWPKHRTLPDVLLCVVSLAVAIALLAYWAGAIGLLAGLAAGPLVLAWRYDNATGACFPLVLLLVIVLAILALLLSLTVLMVGR